MTSSNRAKSSLKISNFGLAARVLAGRRDPPQPGRGNALTSEFEIVEANLRDLGELRRLERECFELDAWPLIDLIAVLIFPGIVRLKAVVNGKMAGFVASDLRRGEDLAWIVTIGVLPAFRHRGIARGLMHACEARLTAQRIRLSVRRSNLPAIELYHNESYTQVDVWGNYYADGEDALILEKKVNVD
jgi:ribosomal-protein-alanine N-acetyltransferase